MKLTTSLALAATILLLRAPSPSTAFSPPSGLPPGLPSRVSNAASNRGRWTSSARFPRAARMSGDASAKAIGVPIPKVKVNGDRGGADVNGKVNGGGSPGDPVVDGTDDSGRRVPFPLVLWRFTRPHTLIGSAVAVPSIFLLAAPTYASFATPQCLAALLYASIPALLMNVFITGLNQITDVEIDRINKPELPMAKGDLSHNAAVAVVLTCLALSLGLSVLHPVFGTAGLRCALWGSFVLGTLYSLPPVRLKRHPLLAAFCIVAVRGTIINAGFYSHALTAAFEGASASAAAGTGVLACLLHDWKCALSSFFFGVFGIVIALMKDVPDAHGDRIFNIRSFTVRLGQKRVFNTMKGLLIALFAAFGGGLLKWSTMAPAAAVAARRGLVGLVCWAAGWSANREAREVDPEDSGEVYHYYMHLWKLFYLSYLALPLVK
ncbi:hypothetical protein ACHAWF_002647 [Thalassiosira exigua]